MVHLETSQKFVSALRDFCFLPLPHGSKQSVPPLFTFLIGGSEAHVFDDRQFCQTLGELKSSDHAKSGSPMRCNSVHLLAIEIPLTRIRLIKTSQQIEESCFARSIRTDQGSNRTLLHFKVIDIDCDDSTKLATNIVGSQNRIWLAGTWNSVNILKGFACLRSDFAVCALSVHRRPSPCDYRIHLVV